MTFMTDQTFTQTLDYLYGLLPAYQKQGASAFKKDLSNIKELCWELGLPQWQINSIHIAGTNGKGSVASMLTSILMKAGYKVGLYTSPHLHEFTERIRINGKEIPRKEVVAFVQDNRMLIEKVEPSFFELTVAMAFDYFARMEVDIAVVETGLGGRLDSTNILTPEMSIITNISYDHQALLGDTLAEIAGEKAGIIKKYTPVVIGESDEETQAVFLAKAGVEEAPLVFADQEMKAELISQDWDSQTIALSWEDEYGDEEMEQYKLDLTGNYQINNVRTVIAAVRVLREDGWEIDEKALKKGLRSVCKTAGLRGRMEKLGEKPLILCDTGHNEAGVQAASRQLKEKFDGQIHIVWGMVSDKDHVRVLAHLPRDARYYWVTPEINRGLSALSLQLKAEALGLNGGIFDGVEEGLKAALEVASEEDLIFIGGSTFVVGEALGLFE